MGFEAQWQEFKVHLCYCADGDSAPSSRRKPLVTKACMEAERPSTAVQMRLQKRASTQQHKALGRMRPCVGCLEAQGSKTVVQTRLQARPGWTSTTILPSGGRAALKLMGPHPWCRCMPHM